MVKIENGEILKPKPDCLKPDVPCGQRGLHCYAWVDVIDSQPPEEHTRYLTVVLDSEGKQDYAVSTYCDNGFWVMHNLNWKMVTHWMPLPEFPLLCDELAAINRCLDV